MAGEGWMWLSNHNTFTPTQHNISLSISIRTTAHPPVYTPLWVPQGKNPYRHLQFSWLPLSHADAWWTFGVSCEEPFFREMPGNSITIQIFVQKNHGKLVDLNGKWTLVAQRNPHQIDLKNGLTMCRHSKIDTQFSSCHIKINRHNVTLHIKLYRNDWATLISHFHSDLVLSAFAINLDETTTEIKWAV